MKKQSAGILLYRMLDKKLEIFLVHPGGPFWKNKDIGAWTIPKGEFDGNETALDAAVREFQEETGHLLPGPFHTLAPIRQKGGKQVFAWATPGDLDAAAIKSNTFEMEWPPRSGRMQSFPEVSKGAWFDIATASQIINPAQTALLDELTSLTSGDGK
ncbi:NUDIX domain-containing protein [Flavitalea sp. BT771]|uniref:NUDIX domain-containing protein n=1 Tax=Flavitalea sp. BT771 TaxID=3063329 RepID=UPI0026E12B9F|nr:NUDIX domain-containing protein [Flavitalea sp. BT771]MDO6429260.1 NUDIX domain-containing protein [Flavitalea sp. BT771]MDV6218612.1 NUDIX domain-containing protein [Flavitalea sp. BT771]